MVIVTDKPFTIFFTRSMKIRRLRHYLKLEDSCFPPENDVVESSAGLLFIYRFTGFMWIVLVIFICSITID